MLADLSPISSAEHHALRFYGVGGCSGEMSFILYWCNNVHVGWEFGHGIFERIEGWTILASTFFLCHRRFQKHRDTLEENAMKAAFYIFAVSFVISTVLIAPFIQHDDVARLSKTVMVLSDATNSLQKN
jgi:hypothetical protein